MADFQIFDATLSRTELGLFPLPINDHLNYILNDEQFGGTVTWNRQTTKSPYVDGEITVGRTLAEVEERLSIDCLADSSFLLQQNIAQLVRAISQSRYVLTIYENDAVWAFDCEAADYTVGWEKSRRMVYRATVQLLVRRRPKLLTGGF